MHTGIHEGEHAPHLTETVKCKPFKKANHWYHCNVPSFDRPKVKDCPQYTFTQTLNNRLVDRMTSEEQYDATYDVLVDFLRQVGCKNIVVVAELTQNMIVHYHGFFDLPGKNLIQTKYLLRNSKVKYLKAKGSRHPARFFGFVDIDVCSDFNGWVDYILGDIGPNSRLLNRRPIVIDDIGCVSDSLIFWYGIEI